MAFPETTRLELPILQELKATGGSDQVQYLYDRLVGYFPQLTIEELTARTEGGRSRWRLLVQRAGKELETSGEIKRKQACWTLTPRGSKRVESETMMLDRAKDEVNETTRVVTHKEAQAMLVEIGLLLGHHAAAEFAHYDVVWRDSLRAPRLSHVFEVQISGSVDSALTRLKQAYDAQRSRPFLIIADERDHRFVGKRLTGSFHEIWQEVTVIGMGELQRLYKALKAQESLITKLVRG